MGMDIDFIAANNSIIKISKILDEIPHGQRKEITDDIILFENFLSQKYLNSKEEKQLAKVINIKK